MNILEILDYKGNNQLKKENENLKNEIILLNNQLANAQKKIKELERG